MTLPVTLALCLYLITESKKLNGIFSLSDGRLFRSSSAGFIVALTGDILTMPGLPKVPATEKIDVDENGRISGLF